MLSKGPQLTGRLFNDVLRLMITYTNTWLSEPVREPDANNLAISERLAAMLDQLMQSEECVAGAVSSIYDSVCLFDKLPGFWNYGLLHLKVSLRTQCVMMHRR